MEKILKNAALAMALIVSGMVLEHVRVQTQPRSPLPEATISHVGFVVKDIDKTLKEWGDDLQGKYDPIHIYGEHPQSLVKVKWPAGSGADPKSYVRTTEIRMKNLELHLMQPFGTANVWKEHLDKYGDGSLEHIAFQASDIPGMMDALVRMGGKIRMGNRETGGYVEMPHLPFMLEINPLPRQ
jgi:hypothetical protein